MEDTRRVQIRRVRPEEWRQLRELRLDALRDAPYAFVTRLETALSHPDEEWRARTAWATFVAAEGSLLVRMATWMPKEPSDGAVLLQMYVRPDARGTGVAARLVDAVVGWARSENLARTELGVNSGNERAARLYARCGFERTGERIHHDAYGDDIRMARMLRR